MEVTTGCRKCYGNRQTDRLTDRQTDWQTDIQTDRQTERQTGRLTERQTGRLTDRQRNRLTDRQTKKQTDWQTDKETDWLTDRLTLGGLLMQYGSLLHFVCILVKLPWWWQQQWTKYVANKQYVINICYWHAFVGVLHEFK